LTVKGKVKLKFPVMDPVTDPGRVMGLGQDMGLNLDTPVLDLARILVTVQGQVLVQGQVQAQDQVRVTTVHGGGPGLITPMVRKGLVERIGETNPEQECPQLKINLFSIGQP